MSGYYASSPHYAPDDVRDEEELQERGEAEAARWFFDLTKAQLDRRNERLAVARAYKGSPRWDRERAAAEREFSETTKEAAAVAEMVLRDLLTTGEVSEATSLAADVVAAHQDMQQAAE